MAKRIYDGDDNDFYIEASEKEKWYRIKFTKYGKANFFLSFSKKRANLDLYLCEDDDDLGYMIKHSRNGAGENETIFNVDVEPYKYYYICVKNRSGLATDFLLRAKIYAETDAAKIAKSMPLTKAFNLEEDIPSDLSTDHALARKNLMMGPIKIDFSAGICSNPSDRKYSLNFDMTEPFLINGATYSFVSEEVTNLGKLGHAIERFLNRRGYEDITFSMGNVNLYEDGTFTVSAFQLQDSHALGDGKYVYTRLDFSRDINFNNFTGFLEFCEASHENDKEYVRAVVFGVAIAFAAFLVAPETAAVVGLCGLGLMADDVLSKSTHYLDFGVVL